MTHEEMHTDERPERLCQRCTMPLHPDFPDYWNYHHECAEHQISELEAALIDSEERFRMVVEARTEEQQSIVDLVAKVGNVSYMIMNGGSR